jgi:hypothetical protein
MQRTRVYLSNRKQKRRSHSSLQFQQMNGASFGTHLKWNKALHMVHFCSFLFEFVEVWHIQTILQSQAHIIL